MKYTETNMPSVCMLSDSTCYENTQLMQIKGVLWHSTGADNPELRRYVQPSDNASDREQWIKRLGKNIYGNDLNHMEAGIGLNAFIGKMADGSVASVQTMPWNYRPWGCGGGSKGSCNDGWIQFEICEDDLTDKNYFEKVYREACELTAYLCKAYGLNPKGMISFKGVNVPVILCHADSYQLGLGSNHGDVYHWFSRYGKTMDTVRNDVSAILSAEKNFLVRVTADALNIRSGAGINNELTGVIRDKGIYTITETKNNWGRLKSGAGWISLDYTIII